MGRIKTQQIKRVTGQLMKTKGELFTDNFEKNKGIVNGLVKADSKKLKNIIAGYATRIVRRAKDKEAMLH
jgi:small subunit ribosomal protein S17e